MRCGRSKPKAALIRLWLLQTAATAHSSVYRHRGARSILIKLWVPLIILRAHTLLPSRLPHQEHTRSVLPPPPSGVKVTSPATNAPKILLPTAPPPTSASPAQPTRPGQPQLRPARRTTLNALRIKYTTVYLTLASKRLSANPTKSSTP